MPDPSRPAPLESALLSKATTDTAIRHGFFTRQGGVSEGIYAGLNVGLGSHDTPAAVRENRSRVCAWFDAEPDRLATVHQVHSAESIIVEDDLDAERPKADGLATRTAGVVLGVLTADCGPVLMADPQAGVIAACHAGWRGAFGGIVENTVAAMETLGAARRRIVACLGPTIGRTAYEVGPEFVARFVDGNPDFAEHFVPAERPGHSRFDLPAFILRRCIEAGIEAETLGACTYDDEARFFSFRRTTHRGEPDYGRQISAISMTE